MQAQMEQALRFFQAQSFVVVSTIDAEGFVHNSCKDIVHVTPQGRVFLLDLYHGSTEANVRRDPHISLTAVDEHHFKGFCLKGRVISITQNDIDQELIKAWDERMTSRVTKRLLKNVGGDKGHPFHPELSMPTPKYLIAVDVERVVDLAHYQNRGSTV